MSKRRHGTGFGRVCRICGGWYSARAMWCPRCYDDYGNRLPLPSFPAAQSLPSRERDALDDLNDLLIEIGRFDAVRKIALGCVRGAGFDTELANACIRRRDGVFSSLTFEPSIIALAAKEIEYIQRILSAQKNERLSA